MSKSVVSKTLALIGQGYVQYLGEIADSVYEELRCRKEKSAIWFVRTTPESMLFVCMGCNRGCSLRNPDGFQAVLPVEGKELMPLVAGVLPMVSERELLEKKVLLNRKEAMAILRVKDRKFYDLVESGQIVAHEGLPIRVTTSSVRKYLKRTREEETEAC